MTHNQHLDVILNPFIQNGGKQRNLDAAPQFPGKLDTQPRGIPEGWRGPPRSATLKTEGKFPDGYWGGADKPYWRLVALVPRRWAIGVGWRLSSAGLQFVRIWSGRHRRTMNVAYIELYWVDFKDSMAVLKPVFRIIWGPYRSILGPYSPYYIKGHPQKKTSKTLLQNLRVIMRAA